MEEKDCRIQQSVKKFTIFVTVTKCNKMVAGDVTKCDENGDEKQVDFKAELERVLVVGIEGKKGGIVRGCWVGEDIAEKLRQSYGGIVNSDIYGRSWYNLEGTARVIAMLTELGIKGEYVPLLNEYLKTYDYPRAIFKKLPMHIVEARAEISSRLRAMEQPKNWPAPIDRMYVNTLLYTKSARDYGNAIVVGKETDMFRVKFDLGHEVLLGIHDIGTMFTVGGIASDDHPYKIDDPKAD